MYGKKTGRKYITIFVVIVLEAGTRNFFFFSVYFSEFPTFSIVGIFIVLMKIKLTCL